MEKISILDRFLKKAEKPGSGARIAMVDENTAVFSSYDGNAYANDIYRGAVDAIARNAGKLKGSHVIRYADHNKVDGDCKLNRILQVQPNPYMSAYDFLYKLVTHYYLYNNSFALIDRRGRSIAGIYPITCNRMEFKCDTLGELYGCFCMKNGKTYIFPYSDIIHLRRNFNNDDLLGDDNEALTPALELAHTQNEGIINGIKSGAHIRGILKFNQIMAPAMLREAKQDFINDYLKMDNDGGIAAVDQKMEYTPVESKPVTISEEQSRAARDKIYNYLGITEKIVSSSYTEDEFSAFYESTLEPLAVQMSLEFTRKIFNDREQAYGNSILFESGRLQFTSNGTKVQLIKELMPYGLLTVNQALEILNLPAVEDGDKRLQTLNVIDAAKANKYQVGQEGAET